MKCSVSRPRRSGSGHSLARSPLDSALGNRNARCSNDDHSWTGDSQQRTGRRCERRFRGIQLQREQLCRGSAVVAA
jgi:hypothetical protein